VQRQKDKKKKGAEDDAEKGEAARRPSVDRG